MTPIEDPRVRRLSQKPHPEQIITAITAPMLLLIGFLLWIDQFQLTAYAQSVPPGPVPTVNGGWELPDPVSTIAAGEQSHPKALAMCWKVITSFLQ